MLAAAIIFIVIFAVVLGFYAWGYRDGYSNGNEWARLSGHYARLYDEQRRINLELSKQLEERIIRERW